MVFHDESDDEKSENYSSEIGSSAFQYKKSSTGFGFEENSGITKVNFLQKKIKILIRMF